MVEILGLKRLIGIVVLLVVNILIGSALLLFFMPQIMEVEFLGVSLFVFIDLFNL